MKDLTPELKSQFEKLLADWEFDENYPTSEDYMISAMLAAYNLGREGKEDLINKIDAMVIVDSNCGIEYQTGFNDGLTEVINYLKTIKLHGK